MVRLSRVRAHADPAAPPGAECQEPAGLLQGLPDGNHRQYLV